MPRMFVSYLAASRESWFSKMNPWGWVRILLLLHPPDEVVGFLVLCRGWFVTFSYWLWKLNSLAQVGPVRSQALVCSGYNCRADAVLGASLLFAWGTGDLLAWLLPCNTVCCARSLVCGRGYLCLMGNKTMYLSPLLRLSNLKSCHANKRIVYSV